MTINALKTLDPQMFSKTEEGKPAPTVSPEPNAEFTRDDRPMAWRVREWLEKAPMDVEFSSRSIGIAIGASDYQGMQQISATLTKARSKNWIVAVRREGSNLVFYKMAPIAERETWENKDTRPTGMYHPGSKPGRVTKPLAVPTMTERLETGVPAETLPPDLADLGLQLLEIAAKLDGYRPPRPSLDEFTNEELLAELMRRQKNANP